jgi:hypothetical protein
LQEAYVLQTHTQHGPVVQNYYMFINNVKQQELCSSCKTIFTSRKRNLINKTHVETYQKRPLRSLRFGCRGKSLLHQRSSQCVRCTKPARLEVEHSQVAGNQQEILIVKAATLRKMMQNYINSKHMKKNMSTYVKYHKVSSRFYPLILFLKFLIFHAYIILSLNIISTEVSFNQPPSCFRKHG